MAYREVGFKQDVDVTFSPKGWRAVVLELSAAPDDQIHSHEFWLERVQTVATAGHWRLNAAVPNLFKELERADTAYCRSEYFPQNYRVAILTALGEIGTEDIACGLREYSVTQTDVRRKFEVTQIIGEIVGIKVVPDLIEFINTCPLHHEQFMELCSNEIKSLAGVGAEAKMTVQGASSIVVSQLLQYVEQHLPPQIIENEDPKEDPEVQARRKIILECIAAIDPHAAVPILLTITNREKTQYEYYSAQNIRNTERFKGSAQGRCITAASTILDTIENADARDEYTQQYLEAFILLKEWYAKAGSVAVTNYEDTIIRKISISNLIDTLSSEDGKKKEEATRLIRLKWDRYPDTILAEPNLDAILNRFAGDPSETLRNIPREHQQLIKERAKARTSPKRRGLREFFKRKLVD